MNRMGGALAIAGRGLGGGAHAVGRGARFAVHLPVAAVANARRRPRRAFIVLGVAAVVLALLAGAAGFFVLRQQQVEAARTAAVAAAQDKVVQLLSYDYRSIAGDVESRTALLTGQFKDDYGSLLRDVVTPAATQQHLTTNSTVAASSVVRTQGTDSVTMLLFLNQTTQSSAKPDPTLSGSRLRVTVQNVDGTWLVSEMTPV